MPADDRSDIIALLHRAALIADEKDPSELSGIYAEDAVFLIPGAPTQNGIDEIIAAIGEQRAAGSSGPGSQARHLVHPMTVEVQGDQATAVTYVHVLGGTGGTPASAFFGVYHDSLRRTEQGWRIVERDLKFDVAG